MDPEKMKVVDLRKELQQRGLDTKGNKAVLVQRLRDALDAESGKEPTPASQGSGDAGNEEDQSDEPEQSEEEPAKEEPKTAKKEPAKAPPPTPKKQVVPQAASVKKEAVPQTPKKVVKQEAKSPEKAAKEEPKESSPVKTTKMETTAESKPVENGEQEKGKKDEEQSEKMETETRGAKRKREDDDEVEEPENREKKRREDSPTKSPEKSTEKSPAKSAPKETPKKEKVPPKEDEPDIDYDKPQLSWYDSDLHLNIDKENFLSAKPLNDGCFGYVWAGARATHGISSGKVCFEVKITEELKWEDPTEKMQERTDKQLKDRFRIDRRNKDKKKTEEKKAEDKSKESVADGEKDKDGKPESENEKPSENGDKSDEKSEKTEEKAEKSEEKSEEKMETDESKSGEKESKETIEKEEKTEESVDTTQKDSNEEKKEEGSEKPKTEENKEKAEEKPKLPPIPTHYFRVGFSLLGTSLQLGEAKYSYAYESTGKFITNKEFQDYGITFGVGDVVGAYLSIDDKEVSITFTVNGVKQPTAITVPRSEFPEENFSLFPHVLCRNYAYELNFGGKEELWFPQPEELEDYQFLQAIETKVAGPQRPEKREECEVILMIGLPGSGKTHWVKNHIAASTDKHYTVIGNNPLFDRMTVDGETMKSRFGGSWKILVDRMQKCLNLLTDKAALRRRNYIIDQTNVFPNAQRRKLRPFEGFNRKAVIVVCDDEEHARRQKDQQNDYGKTVPESTMYDLKAQMELPQKCEWIEELVFPDLNEEDARNKVKTYVEEANKKGYFKRWQPRAGDKKTQARNLRGGNRRPPFGDRRFDRFPGPGWNRPGPGFGGRRDMRGPPGPRPLISRPPVSRPSAPRGSVGGSAWRQPSRGGFRPQDGNRPRDNRNTGGFGGGRNQASGRNVTPWQSSGGDQRNWGTGSNRAGWNAAIYGSHGYGAWNQSGAAAGGQQQAWKYGANNQGGYGGGQGGYGGGQGGYGGYGGGQDQQRYGGSQGGYGGGQTGYGSNQGGYNTQGGYNQGGYGQQNYNYYGQYGQQQGWGNQQRRK